MSASGAGCVTPQLLLLGAIVSGIAVTLDSIWALTAGAARIWLAHPRAASRPSRRAEASP